jgi:hypothetical protein
MAIKTIRALLKTADIPVAEIAARFGIARFNPLPHHPQTGRMTRRQRHAPNPILN